MANLTETNVRQPSQASKGVNYKEKTKLRNIVSVTGQHRFGELLAAALLYAKINIFLSMFVSSAFGFSVPVQDPLRPYILTVMILQSNIQCMNSWWPNPNALSKC